MCDPSELPHLHAMLTTLRRRLAFELHQQALKGLDAPFSLAESIRETREEIVRIIGALRSYGVSVEEQLNDTASPACDPANRPAQQLHQGLLQCIKLVDVPTVHSAAVAFRTDFEAASEHIKTINYFKRLHDLFQDLEVEYNVMEKNRIGLEENDSAWDHIALHETDAQVLIEELLILMDAEAFAEKHTLWVRQLRLASADLHAAVETSNARTLGTGLRCLSHVLDRELSRINIHLVDAAAALRLSNIINAMTTVQERATAAGMQPTAVDQLGASIEQLSQINTNLGMQVRNHRAWQDIDDELRRIDANVHADSDEIVLAWPDLKRMSLELCGNVTDEWACALRKLCDDLQVAIASQSTNKITYLFRQYRTRASRRFRRVDDKLLELCNDLQKLGELLNALLKALE